MSTLEHPATTVDPAWLPAALPPAAARASSASFPSFCSLVPGPFVQSHLTLLHWWCSYFHFPLLTVSSLPVLIHTHAFLHSSTSLNRGVCAQRCLCLGEKT